MTDEGPVAGAIALGLTLVVLVLVAILGGAFFNAYGVISGHDTTVSPETGSFVVVDSSADTVPNDPLVASSSGNGLRFDEDDYVAVQIDDGIEQGDWTVCSYVEVAEDASASSTMDITSAANGSIQLEYDAGEWLIYYDNGTTEAVLKANATSPKTPTTVCARNTGGQISLHEDGSQVASSSLSNATGTRNVSVGLSGVADEIRWSNSSVSNGTISAYATNPTIPFDGTDRVARLMLDEGEGSTTTVYYASATADIVGASWTDGVDARTLQQGSDYEWAESPWSIKVLSSGEYAGAPIVHIEWAGQNPLSGALLTMQSVMGTAIVLFAVSTLAIPVVVVVVLVRGSLGDLGSNNLRRR